jgi:hypothetical protein
MNGAEMIEAWRATLASLDKSWVLFENGTCIVFTEPGHLTTEAPRHRKPAQRRRRIKGSFLVLCGACSLCLCVSVVKSSLRPASI